jgi:hypothetical protein
MTGIRQGDIVRASFATTGKVLRIERAHGLDIAILDTGEGANRKIPVSSLTQITHCENLFLTWSEDRTEIVSTTPCQNKPEVCTRRGTWYCQECRQDAITRVKARLTP